jgi:hypothetical protein
VRPRLRSCHGAQRTRRQHRGEERREKREQALADRVERRGLARLQRGGIGGVARLDLGRHGVEAEQAERRHEDRDGEEDVEPGAVEGAIAQQKCSPRQPWAQATVMSTSCCRP